MHDCLKPTMKDPSRIFGALERELIYYRDAKECQVCGADVVWSDHEIHHVEEHAKGGPTRLDNGALVHKHCHPKGNKATAEFADKWKEKQAAGQRT
jgi:5-methylcytosine-specific restriction endonuclease McrA